MELYREKRMSQKSQISQKQCVDLLPIDLGRLTNHLLSVVRFLVRNEFFGRAILDRNKHHLLCHLLLGFLFVGNLWLIQINIFLF